MLRPGKFGSVGQQLEPERVLEYMHYATVLTLTQDNKTSERAREHSEKNWRMMLADLKTRLE